MLRKNLVIQGQSGLHARPASMLVGLAQKFESTIQIELDHKLVDAKSIIGILSLAAGSGTEIILVADGSDEVEAVEAISELITGELVHA